MTEYTNVTGGQKYTVFELAMVEKPIFAIGRKHICCCSNSMCMWGLFTPKRNACAA